MSDKIIKRDFLKIDFKDLKNNPEWISPAELVIDQFGAYQIAYLLGIRPASVYRWAVNNEGRVPDHHHYKILQLANGLNKKITPQELICGKIKKVK